MKSLSGFLRFRQKEIDLLQNEVRSEKNKKDLLQNDNKSKQKEIDSLRQENKLLLDAVYPLTSSGVPLEKLADVLKQIAKSVPKSEIEINRHDASYHDSGMKLASNEGICPDKTHSPDMTLNELIKKKLASNEGSYLDKTHYSNETLDELIRICLESHKNFRFPPIADE